MQITKCKLWLSNKFFNPMKIAYSKKFSNSIYE